MVSRSHKRTAMYRKLQLLRSITNSQAHQRRTSAILDASEYIKGLKQKLEELNQATARVQNTTIHYDDDPMPKLKVEAQEKGFLIKVASPRNCQGLLVFVLETFEKMGLDVLQARVSCVDNFCFEALGTKDRGNQETDLLNAETIEQAVYQAIQNWRKVSEL